MIKLLFLGEVIGIPTLKKIEKQLIEIKRSLNIDVIVANADGISDGYGILRDSAIRLNRSGVDIITCGDYVFNKKDVKALLGLPFLLKPNNLSNAHGGKGLKVIEISGVKIGVINVLGRVNFNKIFSANPFRSIDRAFDIIKDKADIIVVDFHGGATSEIQAMQWYLAGKVSLVVGSHLRVITSDYRILKDKTAVISGVGFCGGYDSVGGLYPDVEIKKIKYGQFSYSKIATEDVVLQGVLTEIDESSGKASSIDLFNYELK